MRGRMKPYLKIFEDLGLHVVSTQTMGSNHLKIIAEDDHEHRHFFVASNSQSDHRSLKNFRAEVKRWQRSILS